MPRINSTVQKNPDTNGTLLSSLERPLKWQPHNIGAGASQSTWTSVGATDWVDYPGDLPGSRHGYPVGKRKHHSLGTLGTRARYCMYLTGRATRLAEVTNWMDHPGDLPGSHLSYLVENLRQLDRSPGESTQLAIWPVITAGTWCEIFADWIDHPGDLPSSCFNFSPLRYVLSNHSSYPVQIFYQP